MPELPEVETTARGLRRVILGRVVVRAAEMDWARMLPNATATELDEAVRGVKIETVNRRGKYLLIGLSCDRWLAIHRKMSGNVILRRAGEVPEPHTHFCMCFDDGSRLDFVDPRKFGRVYLFASQTEMNRFLDDRLGPEPVDDLTGPTLSAMLANRRGRIKSLLLDQRFIAGLGNLYADEILWTSRISPLREGNSLTSHERGRLLTAIRDVLTEAVERRGTSLSDYVDADGEMGSNQDYLRVYGRAGLPCYRCATPISRVVVGQRGTWVCPRCQRLAGRKAT